MIVGFTGTRKGMTDSQKLALRIFFSDHDVEEGHHGDCIGSDEEFHEICQEYGVGVVLHPPDDDRLRAFCEGALRVEPPRPFLVRNRIITDVCGILLAAPKETDEPMPARGQGTWSTVRYARRSGATFRIVWPEGALWAR